MQRQMPTDASAKAPWLSVHPVSRDDSVAATALRSSVAPVKGKLAGTAARAPFAGVMGQVTVPAGVTFERVTAGGISGWWARPARPRQGAAFLHAHGGWVHLGTATAHPHFVAHRAASARDGAF